MYLIYQLQHDFLQNEYPYYKRHTTNSILLLLYLYVSRILNAGLLPVIKYFYIVVLMLLSKGSEYFFHHCLY